MCCSDSSSITSAKFCKKNSKRIQSINLLELYCASFKKTLDPTSPSPNTLSSTKDNNKY